MSRFLFLLIGYVLLFSDPGWCQSVYERGYFIDLNNQKTECYIKVEAWKAHSEITYLKSYHDQLQTKSLDDLSEIAIDSLFKLKRVSVQIDISGDQESLLSYTPEPEWSTEEIFLWTLVEGNSSLYAYEGGGLKRFFYTIGGDSIEQLIYKRYHLRDGIGLNEAFKQTLFERINCRDSSSSYFKDLRYEEESLIQHFVSENACHGIAAKVYPIKREDPAVRLPQLASLDSEEIPVKQSSKPTKQKESTIFTEERERIRYFGIEMNPLIRQIINLNPNSTPTNNPFQLQFASNSVKTGRGYAIGFSYMRSKTVDNPSTSQRETINREIAFRGGYERKLQLSRRWIVFYGYDLLLGGATFYTETNDPVFGTIVTETKRNLWGLGPRAGLMLLLGDRVTVSTESNLYLRFITDKTTLTGTANSEQKTTEFELTLPIVLFLSVRF